MTSAPLDNRVLQMFNAASTDYGAASANTGEGLQGEWPPEGTHDCAVLSLNAKASEHKGKDGSKVPMIEAQFEYEWLRSEADPTWKAGEPNLIFKGETFRLIPNADRVLTEENHKIAARIAWERFKGHCSKMLDKVPEACINPGADLAEIQTALASSTRMVVVLKVQHRTGKPKAGAAAGARVPIYKTEFITSKISG